MSYNTNSINIFSTTHPLPVDLALLASPTSPTETTENVPATEQPPLENSGIKKQKKEHPLKMSSTSVAEVAKSLFESTYTSEQNLVPATQVLSGLSSLPDFIIQEILSLSSVSTLGQSSRVCKRWKTLISNPYVWERVDLKKEFPSLRIIDEAVWEKHFNLKAYALDMTGAPLNIRTTIRTIKELFKLKTENNLGVTLLKIPKGLSLNILAKMVQTPKEGHPTKISSGGWKDAIKQYGNETVGATYTVAITNSILEKTREGTYKSRKAMVEKQNCRLPKLIEASTFCLLTHISSQKTPPERPLGDEPITYTKVSNVFNGCPLDVGYFSLAGLIIDFVNSTRNDSSGALAVKTLD